MYPIVYIWRTNFSKKYTIQYIQSTHFVNNIHNFIYSTYTVFKRKYTIFQKTYSINCVYSTYTFFKEYTKFYSFNVHIFLTLFIFTPPLPYIGSL